MMLAGWGRGHEVRFLPLPSHVSLQAERKRFPVQVQEMAGEQQRALVLQERALQPRELAAQVLVPALICAQLLVAVEHELLQVLPAPAVLRVRVLPAFPHPQTWMSRAREHCRHRPARAVSVE